MAQQQASTPVSPLRHLMLDDMAMRGLHEDTHRNFIMSVRNFAAFLGRSHEPTTASGAQRQCGVKSPDQVEALFKALPDSLAAVATAVHQRAPSARLVTSTTYPYSPDTFGCPDKVPLSNADAYRVRMTFDRLETDIKRAAAASGSLCIPNGAIGMGHDACSDMPFVADYTPPVTPSWPYAIAYHPTQAGMAAIENALDAALGS